MSQGGPDSLDRVFKALGSLTRRRILRLLAQRPRYAYELSKILGLTGRGVLKHLVILQEAGLVEKEQIPSDLGPDRSYYKLYVSFGLSTTILPNAFVVRITRSQSHIEHTVPPGYTIPDARPDVRAVKSLLRKLEKVNKKLKELDEERMQYADIRGQIIQKIESIMEQCEWDQDSCHRIRVLLNPVQSDDRLELSDDLMSEALPVFEELLSLKRKAKVEKEQKQDVPVDFD